MAELEHEHRGRKIDVLDHGHVRLVDYMGDDMSIVRAARVSYNAEARNDGSDEKLIRYLMQNRHTSPFEMVEFTFDCKMPIFIARQWVRHRTASINEVSARYTELPSDFYIPTPEDIGVQSTSSKQARVLGVPMTEEEIEERTEEIRQVEALCGEAYGVYQNLITKGWPRELARMVLPVNIYTHWYWKMDLHNLLHFIKLRTHPHAQQEIRQYAEAMLQLIKPIVPVSVAAFEEFILEKE